MTESKIRVLSSRTVALIQICMIILLVMTTFLVSRHYYDSSFMASIKTAIIEDIDLAERLISDRAIKIQDTCLYFPEKRLTLIDPQGNVLCDSNADPLLMENHLNRPEVVAALKGDVSFHMRESSTLKKRFLYAAKKVEINQKSFIVRGAVEANAIDKASSKISQKIILYIIPAFAILTTLSLWVLLSRLRKDRLLRDKLKEDLLANISHEIKTPLTSLKGFVQLLDTVMEDKSNKVVADCLQKIERNANRIDAMFTDVLELVRLEGKSELEFEEIELDHLLQDVSDMVSSKYRLKNIRLNLDLNVAQIHANYKSLDQIFTNLLDNAFKYTPTNGRVWAKTEVADGKLHFSVGDTGVGIPRDDVSKVFERFYRVDPSRSREMGGTGLGLAIVKHGVMRHQGEVWVESEEGKGSIFHVSLPLKQK